MDKGKKLRRYRRKDYTQLVDFPVEIVGRDGVVRKYTFEESVRLYQRRVASAGIRYKDDEVVSAETQHCRQRIEQLRKSYFARYGWSAIQVVNGSDLVTAAFAGEVAAFLRRCLRGLDVPPEATEFAFLEESEHAQVYFISDSAPISGEQADDDADNYLLYLYHFNPDGGCTNREAFFRFLKLLQAVHRVESGVESLVAFHHTADCGLILTGKASDRHRRKHPEQFVPLLEGDWLNAEAFSDDPMRAGLMALRRGSHNNALALFVKAYEGNHYRRPAYVGAAAVADLLGRHAETETAALMGTRYFPGDSVLLVSLALCRLRRGSLSGARESLALAEEVQPLTNPALIVRALVSVIEGDLRGAHRDLKRLVAQGGLSDPDLKEAHHWARLQLFAHFFLRLSLVILCGVAVTLLALGWWQVGLAVLVSAGLVPLVRTAWLRNMRHSLALPGRYGLRVINANALSLPETGSNTPQ